MEDYFCDHQEELYEYELKSAQNIFNKKINVMDKEEIKNYLRKKGYSEDIIKQIAINGKEN